MNKGNELFQKNQNLVYYAIRLYYPRLIGDKDAIQTALITLWRASENYKPYLSKFSTYALTAIRRSLNEYYHKEKKHRDSTVYYDDFQADEEGGDFDAPLMTSLASEDKNLSEAEFNTDLDAFEKTLLPAEKEVYKLLMEGYSQTEAAKKLQLARYRISHIVKSIGDKWNEREGRTENAARIQD